AERIRIRAKSSDLQASADFLRTHHLEGIGVKTADKFVNLVACDGSNFESFHYLSNTIISLQTCANEPSAGLLRSQTFQGRIVQRTIWTEHCLLSTMSNRANYECENVLCRGFFFWSLHGACCFARSY